MSNSFATPEGTQIFASYHEHVSFRRLGDTELLVSPFGFGTYRVGPQEEHQKALQYALAEGVNLIDTSSNYTHGHAETVIGNVLNDFFQNGDLQRDQMVVVSKAGYIQGEALMKSKKKEEEGDSYSDLVELDSHLQHCIHPDFLEDQLSQSLDRLKLDRIDVYLLHNPEYYLTWAKQSDLPLAEARDEYYRRITEAFSFLEEQVELGKISYYGISSNTFPLSSDVYDFTSLDRLLDIVEEMGFSHFKVIQLPFNLIESGGISEINSETGSSVLELARSKGLGVLVNRPLNAISDDGLFRLVEYHVSESEAISQEKLKKRLSFALEKEDILNRSIQEMGTKKALEYEAITLMARLSSHLDSFTSYEQWRECMQYIIFPEMEKIMTHYQSVLSEDLLKGYMEVCNEVSRVISIYFIHQRGVVQKKLKELMSSHADQPIDSSVLSHMVLDAYRGVKEIDCVLVGMRQESYVEHVVENWKLNRSFSLDWKVLSMILRTEREVLKS